MVDKKQLAIDFANSLNHPEIEKIILFGSVARKEDRKGSDIDILIITKNIDDDLKIEDDIYEKTFDILIGYSDHSPGSVVVLGSIALGACVIEKHFTLNKKDKGPDHNHSMDVSEFTQMVKDIRALESAMGGTQKFVVEEESETVIVQRRGLYAKRDIRVGEVIHFEDIDVLRPALGIPPKYKSIVAGKSAIKNIEKGMPIFWDNF